MNPDFIHNDDIVDDDHDAGDGGWELPAEPDLQHWPRPPLAARIGAWLRLRPPPQRPTTEALELRAEFRRMLDRRRRLVDDHDGDGTAAMADPAWDRHDD